MKRASLLLLASGLMGVLLSATPVLASTHSTGQ